MESLKYQKGSGYKPYKRWEHYWQYRVLPDGSFPSAHQIKTDWQQYITKNGIYKVTNSSNWTSLGPTTSMSGYSGIGRVNRLTFVPGNTSIIYASTPGGGLWRTTNAGESWTALTDYLPSIGTTVLVVDHANANTLYMATGDADGYNVYSIGVLKSTNAGQTWTETGLKFDTNQGMVIYSLVQHPVNASILLAGTSRGLYRTENAGASWQKVVDTGIFYDLEFKPGSPETMYAGISGSVLRSTNTGLTWSNVLQNEAARRTSIAVSPANPSLLGVLMVNTRNAFLGYFTSESSGDPQSFTQKSSTPNVLGSTVAGTDTGGQGWYDLSLAISPQDANQVWVGGINIWKSLDGGTNWTHITHWYRLQGNKPAVHADQHELLFQNSETLFVANDGGVYFTKDGGSTWKDISNGLIISQMYAIGVSQTDQKVIAGLQDNGTKLFSNQEWSDHIGGDGMQGGIDPTNSDILYTSLQNGRFFRTLNAGLTWKNISPDTVGGAWVSPFVIDPANASTLYIGLRTLYKSTDRGDTWSNISPGLTGDRNLGCVSVSQSHPNTIYVSWYNQGSKLFKTTDGGQNWIPLTPPHNSNITSITVDHKDHNTLYLTFSNYDFVLSKVFKSKDGGTTWTNFSENLPNVPANVITLDKQSSGGMYLGMDVGVFYRDPTMDKWALFNKNLPNVEVFDLEIRYKDRTLVAGTYGRGMWETPLNQTSTSISDGDGRLPQTYNLGQNYPNPFNPSTSITFSLPKTEEVRLEVFDLSGRNIRVLAQGTYAAGHHTVQVDARGLASGIYIYRLDVGSHRITQKMTLIK
jgi:photosystem II stability/assembly factor-like uncharacterized protein